MINDDTEITIIWDTYENKRVWTTLYFMCLLHVTQDIKILKGTIKRVYY